MRTAFVVIHGIGEQRPFETLDPFVRGIVREMGADRVRVSHEIAVRMGKSGGEWNESFVRVTPVNDPGHLIDLHEYYWAYLTEKKISPGEVFHWIAQTLQGTKRYARDNAKLEEKYRKHHAYAHRMRGIYWATLILYWMVVIVRALVPKWFAWTRWLHEAVDGWGTAIVVGYIGDIAIYTTMDEKSSYYRIRQQILAEAQALVDAVLDGDGTQPYDRVIIAGHSLGSVIAYDTFNRFNIAANLGTARSVEKLHGLITFGSPLDKIAFFFRDHTAPRETVRRQILSHLHSFKSKNWDLSHESLHIGDPLKPKLDHIPWVNYYGAKDPVSGHLDFYKIDDHDNVELDLHAKWGVAHTAYWENRAFYQDIVRRFLSA